MRYLLPLLNETFLWMNLSEADLVTSNGLSFLRYFEG